MNILKKIFALVLTYLSFLAFSAEINSVATGKNSSGEYEIQIGGKGFKNVGSYNLNSPARIVVDIPKAKSHLTEKITKINHPIVAEVAVIEGSDRVRATISLARILPYKIDTKPNKVTIAIKDGNILGNSSLKQKELSLGRGASVSFSRGKTPKQAKVQILLPNDRTNVDIERKGNKIIAKLTGSVFRQPKRLNVNDFGTPVKTIDIHKYHIDIFTAADDYELVSYQTDKFFFIELSKNTADEAEKQDKLLLPGDTRKEYAGNKLSLNFQDINVRAVLQLIGDFTKQNIVVSDAVSGSITLRLNDVPWDQALDIILQTKGLSMQKNGNVIYIAPSADIAASKRAAYEVVNVEKNMAPLQQQLIQVQYARAEDLGAIIKANSKRVGSEKEGTTEGLLSARGSLSVDKRTNTLIVNDVPRSIDKVIDLLNKLDVAVDQVLIDARVVTASSNFAHELGVRWGSAGVGATNNMVLGVSGKLNGANSITQSALANTKGSGQSFPATTPSLNNRLGVNLLGKQYGSLGLSLLGSDFLVDMELSAMEDEGRGEVISSPRVIAQNGGSASIKQGKQVPFNKSDDSGNTTTTFKDVPLELTVTPKIAPNNQVDMDLQIRKNALSSTGNGIDTNEIKTKVLVASGETIVLGGVYQQEKNKTVRKVPFFGDLPIVGRAFRHDQNAISKSELLIFVTPKIIDKQYMARDRFNALR